MIKTYSNIKELLNKLSINEWIMFFVFIPFLLPWHYVSSFPLIMDVLTYVSMILMLIICIKYLNKIAYFYAGVIALLYLVLVVASLKSHVQYGGEYIDATKKLIKMLLLCTNVGVMSRDDRLGILMLRSIRNICFFFFIINFYYLLRYPKGIPELTDDPKFPYFIYGNINTTVKFILPGIISSVIIDSKKNKFSLYSLTFLLGVIYTYVFVYRTSTSLVGVLIIYLGFFLRKILFKHTNKLYILLLLIIVFFNLTLVVFPNTGIIQSLAGLFGKDGTFTNRTMMWENAMDAIKNNPLIGYGQLPRRILPYFVKSYHSAHNYYIDITFQRGIIGLVLFIVLLLAPIYNMKKNGITIEYYLVLLSCSAYLLMFLFEPFYNVEYLFVPLFYLAASYGNGKRIIINDNSKKKT